MDFHQFDGFFPTMLRLEGAHSYGPGLLRFVDLIPYFGVDIIINVLIAAIKFEFYLIH